MGTKIKVKPEGRKDMWLVADKKSLKDFIRAKKFKQIHNFICNGMLLGADHKVKSVLEDIENAERIAVMTDPSANMGHALAIADGTLEIYDIGILTESDLEVVS